MSITFLYPGTGAQYLGMGRDFNASVPPVRRFLDDLRDMLGYDLRKTMFRGPEESLFPDPKTPEPRTARVICALSLAIDHALRRGGVLPHRVAGRSTGEFTAAMAEGALGLREGFRVARDLERASLRVAAKTRGRLMSVFGMEEAAVRSVCRKVSREHGPCEMTTHLPLRKYSMVAGTAGTLRAFEREARARGRVRTVPSREAGPYHSPKLMGPHEAEMKAVLEGVPMRRPRVSIWCNLSGKASRSPEVIRKSLIRQVSQPVPWQDLIMGLIRAGTRCFVEVGPGMMLTEFSIKLPDRVRVLKTDTPAHLRATIRTLRRGRR